MAIDRIQFNEFTKTDPGEPVLLKAVNQLRNDPEHLRAAYNAHSSGGASALDAFGRAPQITGDLSQAKQRSGDGSYAAGQNKQVPLAGHYNGPLIENPRVDQKTIDLSTNPYTETGQPKLSRFNDGDTTWQK